MNKYFYILLLSLTGVCTLLSCSDESPGPQYVLSQNKLEKPSSVSVSSITLNQTSLDLSTGSTYQLSATVNPSNATNKSVMWSSSNTDVATVSSSGLLIAQTAGSATITATADDGSGVKANCSVTVITDATGKLTENGHEYVDLGLSVKWATCNVGASSPEDYGDYYAWGDTDTWFNYTWSTYKWCNGSSSTMTKYCTNNDFGTIDNKIQLEVSDDVAHMKWMGTWRMPTRAEQDELRTDCVWTWDSTKKGYKVTSKKNGNSIFLPAAGYRGDSSIRGAGSYGYYWSSELYMYYSYYAYELHFYCGYVDWLNNYRYYGLSVRPVCLNSSLIAVSSITFNQTSLDLATGSTYQLSATVSPSNATNKSVSWSSSNTSVATVSSSGLVTAKEVGLAYITATAADGSGAKATCSVSVKNGNSFDKEDFGSDNNWN